MRPRALLVVAPLLFAAAPARAVKCPNIMLVLDQSGSMRMNPNGGQSPPSKWMLLQQAVASILNTYGNQVPFGLELFTSGANDDQQCYADTKISVEPADGTATKIGQIVMGAMPNSGTNTGEAIKRARVDPAMMDNTRGDYIILITDGDPNCNSGDQAGTATYTLSEIAAAAMQSPTIQTFVIGFDGSGGVNPANLNAMAMTGGQPRAGCTGMQGNQCYYSANDQMSLDMALNAIVTMVTGGGEFGTTTCDDSCITSGCPNGQLCTTDEQNSFPHCVPDPCMGVTCPNNSFCRAGMCVGECGSPCPAGQLCDNGSCVVDKCYMKTCNAGQVCNPTDGTCIANPCPNVMCPSGTICDVTTGKCAIDPCRTVKCPMGTMCVAGGNCQSTTGAPQGGCGCTVGARDRKADAALAGIALLALVMLVRRRRR